MSDETTASEQTTRSVAILGADALLAALPSTPGQLANACLEGGFAEVFPASWGDELIAAGCLEQLESHTGPAILCSCPLVSERMRGTADVGHFLVPLISPPEAVARYLRALYPREHLEITYIGNCPGGTAECIDARMSPRDLLAQLAEGGIVPVAQRTDVRARSARDRRRFYSLPGGAPAPQWLTAQWPKRKLVNVDVSDALALLSSQKPTRAQSLIDFAPHLGCVCAGVVPGTDAIDARSAIAALEPPRAESEIVSAAVEVEVSRVLPAEDHASDVTWNEFLAALPDAFGAHDAAHASPPRAPRARSMPSRAYLATRASARRRRVASRQPTSAQLPVAVIPTAPTPAPMAVAAPASNFTRAALSAPDRWMLAGFMLASSVTVAGLTSALTMREMHREATPVLAARPETVFSIAAAPKPIPRDTVSRAPESIAIAPPVVSPPPKREPQRSPHHTAKVIEHHPAAPFAVSTRASLAQPAVVQPALDAPATPPPAPASAPAPLAATPQVLEELRAIHAEIDARKHHMDSLTAALDSLKHISKPR